MHNLLHRKQARASATTRILARCSVHDAAASSIATVTILRCTIFMAQFDKIVRTIPSQSVIDRASRTLHLLLKETKREEMLLREEI